MGNWISGPVVPGDSAGESWYDVVPDNPFGGFASGSGGSDGRSHAGPIDPLAPVRAGGESLVNLSESVWGGVGPFPDNIRGSEAKKDDTNQSGPVVPGDDADNNVLPEAPDVPDVTPDSPVLPDVWGSLGRDVKLLLGLGVVAFIFANSSLPSIAAREATEDDGGGS